jgi:uncharacterized protein (TIGR02996 family)
MIDVAAAAAAYDARDIATFDALVAPWTFAQFDAFLTSAGPFEANPIAEMLSTIVVALDGDGFGFSYGSLYNVFALVTGEKIAVGVGARSHARKQGWPQIRGHFRDMTKCRKPVLAIIAAGEPVLELPLERRAKRAGVSEDDLLAAVVAEPTADAPRLVYADWLMERGDPRGELIRLQCEAATMPPQSRDAPIHVAIAKALFACRDRFAHEVLGAPHEIERGLVVQVSATVGALKKLIVAGLFVKHPIERLAVEIPVNARAPAELGKLVAAIPSHVDIEIHPAYRRTFDPAQRALDPLYARPARLAIRGVEGVSDWRFIFERFAGSGLSVDRCPYDVILPALADHACMPQLRHAGIDPTMRTSAPPNPDEAAWFRAIGARPNLQSIELEAAPVTSTTALFADRVFTAIEGTRHFDLEVIFGSPRARTLHRFDVELTASELERLARAPHCTLEEARLAYPYLPIPDGLGAALEASTIRRVIVANTVSRSLVESAPSVAFLSGHRGVRYLAYVRD